MAKMAIPQRKRFAMGHEPREDPRSGGMVVPRTFGGSVASKKTPVADSSKPTLESRAGVVHPATDTGEIAGKRKGNGK